MTAPALSVEVLTLFPEMFASVLGGSLLGKAIAGGAVAVHLTNPRDFAPGKHKSVDDAPYGGGSGMVMRPDPLVSAIEHVERERGPAHKITFTPAGRPLDQQTVCRLAARGRLLLLCGRYEGIDDRVRAFVDEEISLGDFVLTGGEIAAMAVIDACARRLPGVLGNDASALDESFEAGLLEYPQFTRPPEFRGAAVPEILLSGDHEKVRKWRRREALLRTRDRRPDLFARHTLTDEDRALLDDRSPTTTIDASARRAVAARTFAALVHHPVYDRGQHVITTALTNLDLHDLARSARTFGLAGYFIVTPIEAQRDLARRILDGWREEGEARNDFRKDALDRVRVVASIEEAAAEATRALGRRPLTVATSARDLDAGDRARSFPALVAESAVGGDPLLVLFGTGWGLANEVVDRVDRCLPPIRGAENYNHLSVRSAAAIVLDRLFAR